MPVLGASAIFINFLHFTMPAVENCWLQVWLSSYRIDYVTATFKLQSSEMLIDVVLHEFIAIQAHLLPKALSAAATCSHERILK